MRILKSENYIKKLHRVRVSSKGDLEEGGFCPPVTLMSADTGSNSQIAIYIKNSLFWSPQSHEVRVPWTGLLKKLPPNPP